MDCGLKWEYKSLMNELTQGMLQTKQLRAYLSSVASTSETHDQELLLQKILSSYEQSLLILNWSATTSQSSQPPQPSSRAIESQVSLDGSDPKSDNKKRSFKDQQELIEVSKKRKSQAMWTEQVRADTRFEGPSTNDGYSWRKYGQKDILGAKHPRSYYRCTYRHMQNCWTTKQVQRSNDDPTIFEITYKGTHTCHQATNFSLQPTSPEKQEVKNETAFPFSFASTFSGLTDENRHFEISHVDDSVSCGYSPSFVALTTPAESNYLSASSSQMNNFGIVQNLYHSESDYLSDHIFSVNTSTTSSPTVDEFSLDHLELDPKFPFDNLNFFA